MTAPTFPCFIKKTQINTECSNISVYQGWYDFRDQSVVCQDISKVPCFVNNNTDISVHMGIFCNSMNSMKVWCFVNLYLYILPHALLDILSRSALHLLVIDIKKSNITVKG